MTPTPLLYKYNPIGWSCQDLKQAWGDFLSGLADWDWYATLTLRDPDDPKRPNWTRPGWAYAKRAWQEFVAELYYWGYPVEPIWVRMFELQRWRGVPHIHALIGGVKDLRRDKAWEWCFQRYGINRILPYDPTLGAGYYLCKYVAKDLGDIEFSQGLTPSRNTVTMGFNANHTV